MRKVLIASIFVLAFCVFAFGQNKELSACPKVSVTVANNFVPAGEETTFTANINVSNSNKIEYEWSVERGIIINGQGTNKITVKATSFDELRHMLK